MSNFFNSPFLSSPKFLQLIKFVKIGSLVPLCIGATSIIFNGFLDFPIIPAAELLFLLGLVITTAFFSYSALLKVNNRFERLINWGMVFLVVTLVFNLQKYPGDQILSVFSFFYFFTLFILISVQQVKGKKVEMPNIDVPMILFVLITTIILTNFKFA